MSEESDLLIGMCGFSPPTHPWRSEVSISPAAVNCSERSRRILEARANTRRARGAFWKEGEASDPTSGESKALLGSMGVIYIVDLAGEHGIWMDRGSYLVDLQSSFGGHVRRCGN